MEDGEKVYLAKRDFRIFSSRPHPNLDQKLYWVATAEDWQRPQPAPPTPPSAGTPEPAGTPLPAPPLIIPGLPNDVARSMLEGN